MGASHFQDVAPISFMYREYFFIVNGLLGLGYVMELFINALSSLF